MYKPEFVLYNETYKILLDFEIELDHLIPARRPDLVIIKTKKNEKLHNSEFCRSAGGK